MDALSTYEPKANGLWLKITENTPATIRILTLDPLVSVDKWGNTRFSFVVWNWVENKAQIWSTTPGILKTLVALHRNENWPPLNKIDIEVSATGELLEKRYTITPLPQAKELSNSMLTEAQTVKLEESIEDNKGRLSTYNEESESSGYEKAKATAEALKAPKPTTEHEPTSNDEIDLDDIPF